MASAAFFDLVVGDLVPARPFAEPAEQARAQGGGRGGHRQAPRDAARHEGMIGDGPFLRPLHLDVLEPQVKAKQHRAGVECPLGDQVAFVDVGHGHNVPDGDLAGRRMLRC